jgi:hypothetical protein
MLDQSNTRTFIDVCSQSEEDRETVYESYNYNSDEDRFSYHSEYESNSQDS